MDLKATLKKIGLTETESVIYLTLLKIGNSLVSKIASHSKLYRPYVYDTLNKLLEKGLVSFIVKDNKKYFQALEPSKLLDIENQKISQLKKIIPELNKLTSKTKEFTNAQLLVGKNVVRSIQKDVLDVLIKNKGENLVIGVDEALFMGADGIIMQQFFEELKRNKLKERVLVREGDNFLPAYKSTTSYKYLAKEFFEPTSTFIYGNRVAIILFNEPLYGIIIESKSLANTYRKQFELLWKVAKNKKN